MFGSFELILYFLLILVILVLYAINFGEAAIPKLKARIHAATAPTGGDATQDETLTSHSKSLRSSLRRRRRSLSYSRNNNTSETDVQAIQQENINLKTKLKNLESQICDLKAKHEENKKLSSQWTKYKVEKDNFYAEKNKNNLLKKQVEILTKDKFELREEKDALEKMLFDQQHVIKLALARIMPPPVQNKQFCEEHTAKLIAYRDSIVH